MPFLDAVADIQNDGADDLLEVAEVSNCLVASQRRNRFPFEGDIETQQTP